MVQYISWIFKPNFCNRYNGESPMRGGKREGSGRPKGINIPYKNMSICIREEDAIELKKRASEQGLTVSRFLIDKALGRI